MKRLQPRHYALLLSLAVASACAAADSSSLAPSENGEPEVTLVQRNPLAAPKLEAEPINGPYASFDEFCETHGEAQPYGFEQTDCEFRLLDSGEELGSKYLVITTDTTQIQRAHIGFATSRGVFVTDALSFSLPNGYYVYKTHINVDSESLPGKTVISASQYRGPTEGHPRRAHEHHD